MAEVVQTWDGTCTDLPPLTQGAHCVLIGFAVDSGVRRNGGRTGAAAAPDEIRSRLGLLTPWDGQHQVGLSLLDLGNLRDEHGLEDAQDVLGQVVAALLAHGAVPVILGGGHETAFGHYLGYAARRQPVGIINIDAHLDVRPYPDGRGHSGTPFRQALEHPSFPLLGPRYVCLGTQPHAVSQAHLAYAQEKGCVIHWQTKCDGRLVETFVTEANRLAADGCKVLLTVDADAVRTADVPGVSAPNAAGFAGAEVLALAREAGRHPAVASFDLVEINPRHDRDGQSARWAALAVWQFLAGVHERGGSVT